MNINFQDMFENLVSVSSTSQA